MAIVLRMDVDCPVCGKTVDKQGLENHMRLTNGMGHGPPGEYPAADDEERRVPDAEEIMVEVHVEDMVEAHGEEMDLQGAFNYLGAYAEAMNGRVAENRDGIEDLGEEVRGLREAVVALTEAVEELAQTQGRLHEEVGTVSGLTSSTDRDDSPLVDLDEDRVIRE